MTPQLTGWIRAPLRVAVLGLVLATSGCIPITLKTERVEPTVLVTDVEPDWNPLIGRDARPKLLSDIRHAMLGERNAIEFVEPGILWAELSRRERPGSVQQARDLLDAMNDQGAQRLGLRCLIVIGPQVIQLHDGSQGLPFYSSGPQKTVLQATVLQWNAAETMPRHVQSLAQGIEREGWFPGTPLMFTRIYKKVDTDGAAFRGLMKALLAALPADDMHGRVRVAILAEVDDKTETAAR